MPHYGLVTEQSRKAKAARSLYDYLRQKVKPIEWSKEVEINPEISGLDGIPVPVQDKYRILNLRFHEEHLSPYFKTDMNLFHMLMMDDSVNVTVFRCDRGWLFIFDGIPMGPKPFGQLGYDLR